MRFLFVDNYTAQKKRNLDYIIGRVKQMVKSNGLISDIENHYTVIKTKEQLKEYLYEPNHKLYDVESGKRFDLIDIVFILGDQRRLPWQKNSKTILLLIKQCLITNKPLFTSGTSFLNTIYLCSTNTQIFNIINDPMKNEIKRCIKEVKKPKYIRKCAQLDLNTGDLFCYEDGNWLPQYNIGFHHKEKSSAPLFHLRHLFINNREQDRNSYKTECKVNTSYFGHYLFKGINKKFYIGKLSQWRIHPIEFINRSWEYNILAASGKNPIIVGIRNTISLCYTLERKHEDGLLMLENFVRNRIMEIKNESIVQCPVIKAVKVDKAALDRDIQKVKLLNQLGSNHAKLSKINHCGLGIRKTNNSFQIFEHNSIQNKRSLKYMVECKNPNYVKRQSFNEKTVEEELEQKKENKQPKQLFKVIKKNFNFGNMFTKSNFKYDIDRVEQVRSVPQIRCASTYIDSGKQTFFIDRTKPIKQGNGLTRKKKQFRLVSAVQENKFEGYLNTKSGYLPVSLHRFRNTDKSNWLSKKGFRLY